MEQKTNTVSEIKKTTVNSIYQWAVLFSVFSNKEF